MLDPKWDGWDLVEAPNKKRYDVGKDDDGKWRAYEHTKEQKVVAEADDEDDVFEALDDHIAKTLKRNRTVETRKMTREERVEKARRAFPVGTVVETEVHTIGGSSTVRGNVVAHQPGAVVIDTGSSGHGKLAVELSKARKVPGGRPERTPDKPKEVLAAKKVRSDYEGFEKFKGDDGSTYWAWRDEDNAQWVIEDDSENEIGSAESLDDVAREISKVVRRNQTQQTIQERRQESTSAQRVNRKPAKGERVTSTLEPGKTGTVVSVGNKGPTGYSTMIQWDDEPVPRRVMSGVFDVSDQPATPRPRVSPAPPSTGWRAGETAARWADISAQLRDVKRGEGEGRFKNQQTGPELRSLADAIDKRDWAAARRIASKIDRLEASEGVGPGQGLRGTMKSVLGQMPEVKPRPRTRRAGE